MRTFLVVIATFFTFGSIKAQVFADPNFAAIPIGGTGWDFPTGATFSQDGQKLFVWQKGGELYVCNRDADGNYVKQTQPVIDLGPEVADWDAHGLVGFTLDPNFQSNGLIYLMYVVNRHHLLYFGTPSYNPNAYGAGNATIGRVTRYKTINSGGNLLADPTTRKILIGETKETGMPVLHHSHGVGSLAFAADGTLLVSMGDAASYEGIDAGSFSGTFYQQALDDGIIRPAENVGAFRAQMLTSMNGKLLRIDPITGDGIPSNPFYVQGQPRATRSRVWAFGLRNSFRIAVRPGTGSTDPALGDIGEIYMGDVGFASWEELNIVKAPGMNFGWPIYEGNEHTLPADNPSPSYHQLNVQNLDAPNPLYGTGGCTQQYFTFNQLIRQANVAGDKTVYNPCNPAQPIGTGNAYYHNRPALEWSHAHPWARVGIFDGNNPTVAMIGSAESQVTGTPFPGSCAVGGVWYTGNKYPAKYQNTYFQADFVGPLSGNSGPWLKSLTIDYTDVVTHVNDFAIGFTDIVCVIQNPIDGNLVTVQMLENGAAIKEIVYGGNQPPIAKPEATVIFGNSPLSVNFTGSNSTDASPGGSIVSYEWNFGGGVPATSNVANPANIVFTDASGEPRKFVVTLKVTDNGGASHTESIVISVNNTPPVVNITSPVKNSTYGPGSDDIEYNCTATVTDTEHSGGDLKYEWQTTLRHNTHEHREAIKNEVNSSTLIQRVGFYGSDTYYWLVELTVTDAAGLVTKDSAKVFPNVGVVQGVLNGSVTLQGRPAAPNVQWQVPMTIEFFAEGNMATPAFTHNVTTNTSGSFTINDIVPGSYKIAAKNIHTLKKVSQLQVIGSGAKSLSFGILPEGDINGDNFITLGDLSILANNFNKIVGSPGVDARADLNNDGFITLADISLLVNNFNTAGQSP
jgi:glucose/arabinose dehydrogenase